MRLDRLGRFRVSVEVLTEENEDFRKFIGQFIIVRAEMLYAQDVIAYVAHSPMFDKTEHGDRIPEYNLIASKKDDGTVEFSVERKTKPDFYADNF